MNLTEPAGHGGATVSLTSSNTAAMTCPASVTIPQGSQYVDLYCPSYPVTDSTYLTISGTYKNTTVTHLVTVTPAFMSSFTVNGETVQGGTDVYLAVVMNGLVANDTVITLSGDNPSITVPASLTVPGNTGSGTLLWTTPTVTSQQTVTITATQSWVGTSTITRTVTLTIVP
ncbi:MAG TPA: hypothetical protein VHX14_04995 [Thermoanaerobaculia bacterium]|nr:hypothetical protein [Thermoanaerobaculia bacterium]